MKLGASKRTKRAKSELSLIRHEGNIPAILYLPNQENENLTIDGDAFRACLRSIAKGHLPTTIFELQLSGKSIRAIVKEIQYHTTSYNILHLDFQQVVDDVPLTANVPVEYKGINECVGIKLGGFLRQVKRHLKVKCLPKDLPSEFVLDIHSLQIGQSRRVRDIDVPKGITLLAGEKDVIGLIAKR